MVTATIIIPAHDKVDTLGAVLASLAGQTRIADVAEIIVVDDASRDGGGELARRASPGVPVRVVRTESGGCLALVRNAALALATGDVLIFLDADVVAGPEFVAAHLAMHERRPGAVVIGYLYGYTFLPEARTPEALRPPPPEEILARLPELLARDAVSWRDGREADYRRWRDFSKCPIPWSFCWGSNFSCRRADAFAAGGFDERFRGWGAEDTEFAYRLFQRGATFEIGREAWGIHYPHAVSTANTEAALRNIRYFAEKHPDPIVEFFHFSLLAIRDPRSFRARFDLLDLIAAHPRFSSAPLDAGVLATVGTTGRIAWFGAPPADDLPFPLASSSRPFGADADELRHAGFALPFADAAFETAVVVDYFRAFTPALWPFFCREMSRVAERVVFAVTDARSDEGGVALHPLTSCREKVVAAGHAVTPLFDDGRGFVMRGQRDPK